MGTPSSTEIGRDEAVSILRATQWGVALRQVLDERMRARRPRSGTWAKSHTYKVVTGSDETDNFRRRIFRERMGGGDTEAKKRATL